MEEVVEEEVAEVEEEEGVVGNGFVGLCPSISV